MPRGRTSRHLPSMYITVFLCETLRVRFIFPCALHANLYLVVRVTMFAGDRSLTDKQREMKRCQEVWAVMVVAEARDAKILRLPRRVSPSGGETVTETLRSREGRPGGGRRGRPTSAGVQFSHSSHSLAHSGSWTSFLWNNLLQTGTWPSPPRQARTGQLRAAFPAAVAPPVTAGAGAEHTARAGVAEGLQEAPGKEQELWGLSPER